MGVFNNLLNIVETVPVTLKQMEEAIDRSDSEHSGATHKLKGQLALDIQPLVQQT